MLMKYQAYSLPFTMTIVSGKEKPKLPAKLLACSKHSKGLASGQGPVFFPTSCSPTSMSGSLASISSQHFEACFPIKANTRCKNTRCDFASLPIDYIHIDFKSAHIPCLCQPTCCQMTSPSCVPGHPPANNGELICA